MPEEWVEVELTVVDQTNRRAERHFEFRAANPDPGAAAAEIAGHLLRALGPDRVHNPSDPEADQPVGLG